MTRALTQREQAFNACRAAANEAHVRLLGALSDYNAAISASEKLFPLNYSTLQLVRAKDGKVVG